MRKIIETGLQESVTGINAQVAIASQGLKKQYAQHTSNITLQARVVAEYIEKFAQIHASLQKLEQEKLDATIQEKVVEQVEKIKNGSAHAAHLRMGSNRARFQIARSWTCVYETSRKYACNV